MKSLGSADGAIAKMAKETRTNTQRIKIFQRRLLELQVGMVDFLGPAGLWVAAFGGVFAGIGPILIALPYLIRGVNALTVATFRNVGATVASTAATVAKTVATAAVTVATAAWTAAQWLLNAALTANPIGLVIVAVGALIAAVVLLVKHWDTVTATIKKNWDIILAILFPGVGIAVLIARRWGAIKNAITGIFNSITSTVADWAGTAKEFLLSLFGPRLFGLVFRALEDNFRRAKKAITGFFRRPVEAALDFVLDFDWKKLLPPMPKWEWSGWKGFFWPFPQIAAFLWTGWKEFSWPWGDLGIRDAFKWPGWKEFFWPFSDLSVWLWGKFKWSGWKEFFWPFSDLSVWLWGKFKWPGWKEFFWPFPQIAAFLWTGWKEFSWPWGDLGIRDAFKWPGWKGFFWPFPQIAAFLWTGWKEFSWPWGDLGIRDAFKWSGWKEFFWPFSDLSVWLWGKFKWPGWKEFFWPFSEIPTLGRGIGETAADVGRGIGGAAADIGRGLFDFFVPIRDTGGIVSSPQLAALAMNSRPEAIIPLDRLPEMMDGRGGLTVHVHVTGDVNGVEKLREIIRQGILDGDRRGLEHSF